ncbi:uncharacterized protein LOC112087810 [Eutrema salsugineum]|uniref:uncharacterized protein LOC112087810 n=1 Tax=Eutrema salsugineum TaxID=72664 RepID=UPI000CED6E5D|nr:uncharacterized protein LOC112087810 [Eutrema salsugineum]
MDGKNIESEGVPIEQVLASYIYFASEQIRTEKFLDKLEEKGPKGVALATLRRSERLLFTDDYKYIMRQMVYRRLMMMYVTRGEKQDLRRLWNLAKENILFFDEYGYISTIWAFLRKEDIQGAHEEMVNDMVKDHNEEEKMKRAMEYVEGTIDIESAADVLRLLGKQEPQHVMDSNRLSQKMVEAMRGGAYFGGV